MSGHNELLITFRHSAFRDSVDPRWEVSVEDFRDIVRQAEVQTTTKYIPRPIRERTTSPTIPQYEGLHVRPIHAPGFPPEMLIYTDMIQQWRYEDRLFSSPSDTRSRWDVPLINTAPKGIIPPELLDDVEDEYKQVGGDRWTGAWKIDNKARTVLDLVSNARDAFDDDTDTALSLIHI